MLLVNVIECRPLSPMNIIGWLIMGRRLERIIIELNFIVLQLITAI